MVLLPDLFSAVTTGTMQERVEQSVEWFLDTIGAHGKTFVAVIGAEGVGNDSDVEAILAEADDIAAERVLLTVGVPQDAAGRSKAMIRAYGGLVKAAIREWVRDRTLTRDQVQVLLSQSLITIIRDVLPAISEEQPT
jgi:hypothetical protein